MSKPGPGKRRHGGVWVGLGGLVVTLVLGGLALSFSAEPPLPELAPIAVSWEPARPVQGHLFVIRLAAPPEDGLVSATGEAGGEELHFHRTDSILESLAPVPIGAVDTIDARIEAHYRDGRSQTDSLRIPIIEGAYEHERLTVAPRFGSPLGVEDQARLRSDQVKAAQVAREAHATPRLW